jgi:diacylglycerol kinase
MLAVLDILCFTSLRAEPPRMRHKMDPVDRSVMWSLEPRKSCWKKNTSTQISGILVLSSLILVIWWGITWDYFLGISWGFFVHNQLMKLRNKPWMPKIESAQVDFQTHSFSSAQWIFDWWLGAAGLRRTALYNKYSGYAINIVCVCVYTMCMSLHISYIIYLSMIFHDYICLLINELIYSFIYS